MSNDQLLIEASLRADALLAVLERHRSDLASPAIASRDYHLLADALAQVIEKTAQLKDVLNSEPSAPAT